MKRRLLSYTINHTHFPFEAAKIKSLSLFVFLVLVVGYGAPAQAPFFKWGAAFTPRSGQSGAGSRTLALDVHGNIYMAGAFSDTVDFDPGPGTANLIANKYGEFLVKLNASGKYQWGKSIGNPNSTVEIASVAVDAQGNVYATGSFYGTVDFDPGPNTVNRSAPQGGEIFVFKLDASGDFKWVSVSASGEFSFELKSNSIAVDDQGNVYTTGQFQGGTDFDPGPDTAEFSAFDRDIFILKLNSAGNYQWAKVVPISSEYVIGDIGRDIAVDGYNNVYVTGVFSGQVDFDFGEGTAIFNAKSIDVFILKLDKSGNYMWAKTIGDVNDARSIAIDAKANVYITGNFFRTVDFDPGAGTAELTALDTKNDAYVAKYDSAGNYVWAKSLGGSGYDYGYDISVDAQGKVYTTGIFTSVADFDPGSSTDMLTAVGEEDIFISILDGDGNYQWAGSMGSPSSEVGNAIVVNGNEDVYATGGAPGTLDLDPTSGTFLYSGKTSAAFLIKLSTCNSSSLATNLDEQTGSTLNGAGGSLPISFVNSCRDLVKVSPNGANPVTGSITAKAWVETNQPSGYVKRHYEITPANNASTATANVTLYFTQQEFTDFNAVSVLKLPVDATDAAGNKANLRIEKRSGVSGDESGLPSTYAGTVESIDPDDADIVWNEAGARWEVSFDVAGFSGFFAKTVLAPLPVNLVSFTGRLREARPVLSWKSANETGFKEYVLERSADTRSYAPVATIKAKGGTANTYQYDDDITPFAIGRFYYRLKLVNNDGTYTYSQVVTLVLTKDGRLVIDITPNPVRDALKAVVYSNQRSEATISVQDYTGRILNTRTMRLSEGANTLTLSTGKPLANGVYFLTVTAKENRYVQRFVVQQ